MESAAQDQILNESVGVSLCANVLWINSREGWGFSVN